MSNRPKRAFASRSLTEERGDLLGGVAVEALHACE